jgi:hypothetical protein
MGWTYLSEHDGRESCGLLAQAILDGGIAGVKVLNDEMR